VWLLEINKYLIMLSLFAIPKFAMAEDSVLKCPVYIYKMSSKFLGLQKKYYRTREQSPVGWSPICHFYESREILGTRVSCSSTYKEEWRINLDRPVAQVRRFKCDDLTYPDHNVLKLSWARMASEAEEALVDEDIKLIKENEYERKKYFDDNRCSFYGDLKKIFAYETRTNDGDWVSIGFPEFYPFGGEVYEPQIFDSRSELFGGSASYRETIVDFEIPRVIYKTTILDPVSMEPIGEPSSRVYSCEVVKF